jgi:uncharacterized membrane protein (UPF0127 family)
MTSAAVGGEVIAPVEMPARGHQAPPMRFRFGCLAVLTAAVLGAGCEKPATPSAVSTLPTSAAAPATNPVTVSSTVIRREVAPPYSSRALTNLQTLKLWIGPHEVTAQLAMSPVEMATGMMHRLSIGPEEAMLFPLPRPMQASFYNRNVMFDLGVAYVDPDGVIQEIITLKKEDETPRPSKAPNIQFVLEVAPDWFQRKGVGVGTEIRTPQGPLKQAFTFH